MSRETPALDAALRYYGTATALSRVVGLTPQGISYKKRSGVDLTAEQAFAVHQDSRIPLSVLRPDLWGGQRGEAQ